jgi:hypothetical protein
MNWKIKSKKNELEAAMTSSTVSEDVMLRMCKCRETVKSVEQKWEEECFKTLDLTRYKSRA